MALRHAGLRHLDFSRQGPRSGPRTQQMARGDCQRTTNQRTSCRTFPVRRKTKRDPERTGGALKGGASRVDGRQNTLPGPTLSGPEGAARAPGEVPWCRTQRSSMQPYACARKAVDVTSRHSSSSVRSENPRVGGSIPPCATRIPRGYARPRKAARKYCREVDAVRPELTASSGERRVRSGVLLPSVRLRT